MRLVSQTAPMPQTTGEPASASVHRLEAGPSDEELVQRVRAGDRWAQEALYRKHVEVVAATALRLLRCRAEAEDVTQETFLLALQRMDQLRDGGALRGWLLRIAVSRVHRRFRWRSVLRLLGRAEDEDASLEREALADTSPETRAELALLDQVLSKLRERDRTAWVLRYVVGCSLDEVAVATGCSLASAKRRISAASARVAKHVAVEGSDV